MRNILNLLMLLILSLSTLLADSLIEERGTIVSISDGDTLTVRLSGSSEETRIRFIGIQAMEIHPDQLNTSDDCYAQEARERLIELTGGIGSEVILRAKDENIEILERSARHIFVEQDGEEINISQKLIEEGYALAFPHETEDTYNELYMLAAKQARESGLGLWSASCSSPADSDNVDFDILVNFDADGDDEENLNGEWVKITNNSGRSVDLSGWFLRDSALNFFTFPDSTTISDGATITVYGGSGTNTSNTFYWGNTSSLFDNYGDGVYLMDYLDDSAEPDDDVYPKGNILGSFIFPCVGTCSDTLEGKINIIAHYDAQGDDNNNLNGEWITVTNTSSSTINLQNYLIHSEPEGSDNYYFDSSTPLAPNDVLYLYTGSGTDSSLEKYWNKTTSILANDSDRVWLDTLDSILIDEYSWPSTSTSSDSLSGKVTLNVQSDALGDDLVNPNGEWVTINNISSSAIDIKDYSVKMSSYSYYFHNSTVISANGYVRLYVGSGVDTSSDFYWGNSEGIFANSGGEVTFVNVYNEEVTSVKWPHPFYNDCTYPVEITSVNYDASGDDDSNPNGEYITIKNVSDSSLNLRSWEIAVRHYQYHFMDDFNLASNASFTLKIGSGSDSSSVLYWGQSTGILRNSADLVQILNPKRMISDCYGWGSDYSTCSDLKNYDNDKDGILDDSDLDDDNDGMSDSDELANGRDPLDASDSLATDEDDSSNDENTEFREEIAKLYVATFSRAPDSAGLDYWANDSGLSIDEIAQSFFDQDETQSLYPSSTSNRDFVESVYQNLFNRQPDSAGWDYWENELDMGSFSKNSFILAVINGALDSDADILNNKNEVGLYFANKGLSDTDSAKTVMQNVSDSSSSVDDAKEMIDDLL
jgi:endonuclease YncB( thermonuclease family)